MLTESQIELWTKLFRITEEMSAPPVLLSKVSTDRLEKMIRIFSLTETRKFPQPEAIVESTFTQIDLRNEPAPQERTPKPGLIPRAKVISIRAVDFKNEKTADFFSSLTWQRHDPSVASIPESISFDETEQASLIESCRRFFAYSVPWLGRGTQSEGPQILDSLNAVPTRSSLVGLAEIATQQALHTAKKVRRENDLVSTYTQEKNDTSKGTQLFFQNLPWTTRLNTKKIQHV